MSGRTLLPWTQTKSGHPFPLINPDPADVRWADVACALAHINRYAGNAGTYTVAQHSIHVADVLPPELRAYGLLHDAAEAYTGDMTRPMQLALAYYAGDRVKTARDAIAEGIDAAIHRAAGLAWPVSREVRETIKHADLRVTMAEKRDILTPPIGKTEAEWLYRPDVPEPIAECIRPWGAYTAQTLFTQALRSLGLDV